ncbi:MAG: adenine deaminase [Chloroflexota bacterium]
MTLRDRIMAARGLLAPDLVLKNARVVNVFANDVQECDVAIKDSVIVGLGRYESDETIDLAGSYLMPGLIDGHLHIESTMLSPSEFARAVVPHGTTSVVVDPHEIGNVLGPRGIKLLLDATDGLPINVFVNVPSCVPASPMESPAFHMEAADMEPLFAHPRVVGVAELMNYPGVLNADGSVLAKIELGQRLNVPIDGHAPRVTGKDLCAYVAAGIESDHETTLAEEAEEKLRLGMWLMVREGSTEHNLKELLPVVRRLHARRAMFVTDDRAATDLRDEGHLDHALRLAIAEGLDPVWAVAMASLNAAERFGLKRRGAVAPGYAADLMVCDDLQAPTPRLVFHAGKLVARDGKPLFAARPFDLSSALDTVHIAPLDDSTFRIPFTSGRCRVIGIIPHQIVTANLIEEPRVVGGEIVGDLERDLLKFAVVERHHATGRVGMGLVQGFGLRSGALSSSVAHDAHNIGVVGTNDADMRLAVEANAAQQGGLIVVRDGKVLASLPLPIGGLMSDLTFEEVAHRLEQVEQAAESLGCAIHRPFMTLSFLALSVIPSLKLTDLGLVDVDLWEVVPVAV